MSKETSEKELKAQAKKLGNKGRMRIIWLFFAVFCILFGLNTSVSGENATKNAWLLLEIFVVVIDIVLLIKHGFPSGKKIGLAALLGGLVFITYADAFFLLDKTSGLFTLIVSPALTFLSGLAVFSVFEKYPGKALPVFQKERGGVVRSILYGILFGVLFGTINWFLMKKNASADFSPSIHCLLTSLSPAVLEELVFRTTFYALCISLLKGELNKGPQSFTCYFMMIVPHVMLHTPEVFQKSFMEGLISTVLYVLIFGLIFALLQRKRDLGSAIIAHGLVDFIRFCFFGLPM